MHTHLAFGSKIRWRACLTTAAGILATIIAGAAVSNAQATVRTRAGRAVVDPQLASVAASSPSTGVEVIVEFQHGVSEQLARQLITRAHGTVTDQLPVIGALAASISARGGVSLGSDGGVRAVTLNTPVVAEGTPMASMAIPIESSPPQLQSTWDYQLNAPWAWYHEQDTGQGVGVAVIDTGVQGDLPDFQASQSDPTSRVVASAVVNPDATSADDPYGHGTMVAGIIAGDGANLPSSDPLNGAYMGIAPNASIISVKVGDDDGNATLLDVINGIQFAIDNQSTYDIGVINLSLESDTAESYTVDPLDAAVQAAINAGIVVVASAGNLGDDPDAVDYAPGNDPNAIVVGATDGQQIASWSSQGVTQDGISEPDIYAPGAHIVSVLAPNSAFALLCPSCIIGNDQYITASGTSFAAPMVSGAVADMLQANPTLTPAQVKADLVATAKAIGGSDGSGSQQPGELSVGWAVRAATNPDGPGASATPAVPDAPASAADWTAPTFDTAPDSLTADWARSSWSCDSCTGTDDGDTVDPSRSSWSRSSWSVEGTG